MLNYIWGGMIILSLVVALLTGRVEQTAAAAAEGAAASIESCISLLGIMCLWTGLSKIGERAGLIKVFAKLLKPLTKLLFPRLDPESPAVGSIVMNMVANLFGMGNAATPLGIRAIGELDKLNPNKKTASDEMCMFVVINTASLQLLPATLISLRQTFGSANPGEVIVPVWIVSICALVVGVVVAKLLERRSV
ncbi:MAG: nucleoside recognition domain-containing protein [Clostridia bacterium]|nr:nucleoside recognition domain-containing protein [Clostridia bacterium]